MALPTTNLKFSNLRSLGGTNPIKFSGYYKDAVSGFASSITGIPNRGSSIRMSQFRGKQRIISTQQTKLTASDKEASDGFGFSVSISSDGNTAIVGAYAEDPDNVGNAGSAYIYTKNGTTWSQQTKLTASDKWFSDIFGSSVSISSNGNTAIVGAYQADTGSISDSGVAYIYTRNETAWTQQTKLIASDAGSGDYFGVSVSISGDGNTAIVGAYLEDPNNVGNAGSAYIYTRNDTTWTQQTKLTASDKEVADFFGRSVSISSDGNTVIVGAMGEDPGNVGDAGSVYIYTRNGTAWTQQTKLTASDKEASDFFGRSVSISSDGNTAIVGAYAEDPDNVGNAGSVYIYTRNGTAWTQQTKLTASDKGVSYYFGYSVSISSEGSTAIVGAYGEHLGVFSGAGAAYIFV
jgi:uncharacterized protein YcbX